MPENSLSITPIDELREARRHTTSAVQGEALVEGGKKLRERFGAGPQVHAVVTCDLSTIPYPTRFAFWGCVKVPVPYIFMRNRMHVVQFRVGDELHTLLVNPHEIEGNIKTPYLTDVASKFPDFVKKSLQHCRAEDYLKTLGIDPESVDYITFDHLHTQDLPTILGLYPNAKLLVQRSEWESVLHLHPIQRYWYHPDVTRDVSEERLIFLDGDVELGGGVALLYTPGHTAGNHTITLNTEGGIYCIAENGVAADCYAPRESLIPGMAKFARKTGYEVILNANTVQGSEDQYNSMVLEKTVAGPSTRDPHFFNVLSSSELIPSLFSPGIRPTFSHGRIRHGSLNPGLSEQEQLRTL